MDKQFRNNFLKGSLFTAAGALSSAVFHIIAIMIIARNIPREDFGAYALILAIAALLNIFGSMGLDLTLTKYASEGKASAVSSILVPILILRVIGLTVVCALAYLSINMISTLFKMQMKEYLPYLMLICVGGSFRELLVHLLQGLRMFKEYAALNIFSAMLKCALVALFVAKGGATLALLVRIEVLTAFMTIALAAGMVSSAGVTFQFVFSRSAAAKLIRFAFPLYLNNILTMLHGRMGIFMLGAMSTPIGVALFEVAGKVPEGCTKLFRAFITVYFPNQSMLFSSGRKRDALKIMNRSIGIISAAILTFVLFSFLFQNEIVHFVFSEKYSQAALAFALLMLNFHLRAVVNVMGYSLVSAGFSATPMKVNSVACLVNIVGNLIMIPVFGFMGAVYALLLQNTVSQLMFGYYLAKAGLVLDRKNLLVPPALLLVIGALCLPCQTDSLLVRAVPVIVYFALTCCLMDDLRHFSAIIFSKFRSSAIHFYARSEQ